MTYRYAFDDVGSRFVVYRNEEELCSTADEEHAERITTALSVADSLVDAIRELDDEQ